MNIRYSFKSEGPHLGKSHLIIVEYAKIEVCGTTETLYKKMSYTCREGSDCTFKDEYGRCPLYLDAPSNPKLI